MRIALRNPTAYHGLPSLVRWKTERAPLLAPVQRQMLSETAHGQRLALASLQNGFNEVRGEKRTTHYSAYVALAKPGGLRNHAQGRDFTALELLEPQLGLGQRVDEMLLVVGFCRARLGGSHDQAHRATTALKPRFDVELD